ncbi:hypothetical protein BJV82DRAFT_387900 [Fennellomyces sp. T-0311]|nr:hypothetical protein BJV82DRAFT_387900 [Fennellomyces sp. T-0311]
MSPTASERLHTLDDDKLDEIGYPPTREPRAVERGPRTVGGPTASPPPLSMPQPKHAVAPTQRLIYQQPPPALSAPLTVNSQGNNNHNGSRNAITTTTSTTIESSTTTSPMRTYTTPQPPLSAESEGDKKKLGNKSVVTTSTGINPKPTPSSTAVSDNSHKAKAVQPQSILVRKTGATTNGSPSSSLRKSFSATAMSSSNSQPPPPQEHQTRIQSSLSTAVLQKQHQQQSRAEATPAASASAPYNKATFEDSQKPPEMLPDIRAVIEQNNILREQVNLLRLQQEAWRQSRREMERAKLEMEREQNFVADRLEQLEEQLRQYCLIAKSTARSEDKGKGVAHPTHSRSDPTTASPRKPPSGGGRSPASKRHRSRSVPRFDEEGEHTLRYLGPQQQKRYDDYEYDYEDYATRQESPDEEEEDAWDGYNSRRLPPPPVMRHHQHHHPFPRYLAPPPVVPLAGPSLPPPNRKWEGPRGSLRRRRSGSMTPFMPRPAPPHYHPLPPRHRGWRDSGYDAAAADYAWDEPPPPPSYRSSRYYDEPSDDLDDYPAAQKRYPHDRRLPGGGRDRRTFPAYEPSM